MPDFKAVALQICPLIGAADWQRDLCELHLRQTWNEAINASIEAAKHTRDLYLFDELIAMRVPAKGAK